MLYRPYLNGEQGASKTSCEIIARKNRHGPTGTAHANFNPETNTWADPERGRP